MHTAAATTLLSLAIFACPVVPGAPTNVDGPTPGTVNPTTGNQGEIVESPRIGHVIAHMQQNGGVKWTEDPDAGGSFAFHTFEEWAAAEHAVMGFKANTFAHVMSASAGFNSTAPGPNIGENPHTARSNDVCYKSPRNPLERRANLDAGTDLPD